MEFGSIRFFRRLISLCVLVLIVGLIIALVAVGMRLGSVSEELGALKAQGDHITAETGGEEDGTGNEPDGSNEPEGGQVIEGASFDYQEIYPDIYAEAPEAFITKEKTVYLTFDDGPSECTGDILDLLNSYGIKATFFVNGTTDETALTNMKRIVDEGHSIGIHSYSHEYTDIYSSVNAFLDDFALQYQLIYGTTGVKPDILRFPGGTINKYNIIIRKELTAEIIRRGFTYYDWNASAADVGADVSETSIVRSAIDTGAGRSRIVLLLHDNANRQKTVDALPEIIDYYQENGYSFEKITNEVQPIAFD